MALEVRLLRKKSPKISGGNDVLAFEILKPGDERLKGLNLAAARIQGGFKVLEARRATKQILQKRRENATKVQANFRGYRLRKLLDIQDKAARTLQSFFRSRLMAVAVAKSDKQSQGGSGVRKRTPRELLKEAFRRCLILQDQEKKKKLVAKTFWKADERVDRCMLARICAESREICDLFHIPRATTLTPFHGAREVMEKVLEIPGSLGFMRWDELRAVHASRLSSSGTIPSKVQTAQEALRIIFDQLPKTNGDTVETQALVKCIASKRKFMFLFNVGSSVFTTPLEGTLEALEKVLCPFGSSATISWGEFLRVSGTPESRLPTKENYVVLTVQRIMDEFMESWPHTLNIFIHTRLTKGLINLNGKSNALFLEMANHEQPESVKKRHLASLATIKALQQTWRSGKFPRVAPQQLLPPLRLPPAPQQRPELKRQLEDDVREAVTPQHFKVLLNQATQLTAGIKWESYCVSFTSDATVEDEARRVAQLSRDCVRYVRDQFLKPAKELHEGVVAWAHDSQRVLPLETSANESLDQLISARFDRALTLVRSRQASNEEMRSKIAMLEEDVKLLQIRSQQAKDFARLRDEGPVAAQGLLQAFCSVLLPARKKLMTKNVAERTFYEKQVIQYLTGMNLGAITEWKPRKVKKNRPSGFPACAYIPTRKRNPSHNDHHPTIPSPCYDIGTASSAKREPQKEVPLRLTAPPNDKEDTPALEQMGLDGPAANNEGGGRNEKKATEATRLDEGEKKKPDDALANAKQGDAEKEEEEQEHEEEENETSHDEREDEEEKDEEEKEDVEEEEKSEDDDEKDE